jgi:NAD(P)H-dependent FMN reductase
MLRVVAQGMTQAGAEYDWLDLRDLDLPFFDGRHGNAYGCPDLDRVVAAVAGASVIVVSVPAYWGGPAGGLKNLLDLVGGAAYDLPTGTSLPLAGKMTALLVVGADRGSGYTALATMRTTLAAMGAWTAPRAEVVGDPRQLKSVQALLTSLTDFGSYIASLATASPVSL